MLVLLYYAKTLRSNSLTTKKLKGGTIKQKEMWTLDLVKNLYFNLITQDSVSLKNGPNTCISDPKEKR